ncbi:MAG: DUF1810 domain-containing protein [Acetobacteraceae bacterium]
MRGSSDLDRFVRAQDPVIAQVRRELASGHKTSHWMWFVFPQLAGLGQSAMSRRYALASLTDARAYLGHPVLGPRLLECSNLVNAVAGRSAHAIFGSPDDMKFHSSMTLFAAAEPGPSVFATALDKYFAAVRDPRTTSLLAGA